MMHDVGMAMAENVGKALAELPEDPKDAAAHALALRYADAIDSNPDGLDVFGPKLLRVLDALLLTPRARAAALKGGPPSAPDAPVAGQRSPADDLRAKRAARLAGSTVVDTATS
jgi:hypothetical protein